jgi:hypothetical protein
LVGQIRGKGFHGPFCLKLLHEREHCVQPDHANDRNPDSCDPCSPRQCCSHPQEQRQWVRELPQQLARPFAPSAAHQSVWAVLQ